MSDEKGWYYLRNGDSVGPESSKDLLELLDAGAITRSSLIWRDGAADWLPLEVALALNREAPPPLPGGNVPGMPPIPEAALIGALPEAAPSAIPDESPHPWRRYFARMLDITVGASLMFFAIGVVMAATSQDTHKEFFDWLNKSENRFLNTFLSIAVAILPIGLCIGFTGSSIGKWIFGITVTQPDGKPMGLQTALHRELMIWFRGLGLGIPLVSLFTLITAFRTLKDNKKTSWDSDLSLLVTYRAASSTQMVFNIVGVMLWLSITVALLALSSG